MKALLFALALWSWAMCCSGQEVRAKKQETERTYSQPPSAVKAALKDLPGGTSGRLPVVDGFVFPGKRRPEQYERPHYECQVRISPGPSGGSLVRVTSKITAWYRGQEGAGYEALESNGRIESDLLDRLQERLQAGLLDSINSTAGNSGTGKSATGKTSGTQSSVAVVKSDLPSDISAPVPQLPARSGLNPSASALAPSSSDTALEQESRNLEEILRNQSYPTNLIAVKRDLTPVTESPNAAAKVLFLASAEDEFELLDVNPEWVHVRISGLSRGWLRRAAVEMPGDSTVQSAAVAPQSRQEAPLLDPVARSSTLFSISSDEVGSFPGEWAPMKGKSVKLVSVRQAPGSGRISSPQEKMRFAESVFRGESVSPPAQGLVVIFDSEDGGMVAAATPALEQWKKGAIPEREFWKQCYVDPPELLGGSD